MINVQKHVNDKYCSSVVHVAVVGAGGNAGETEKQRRETVLADEKTYKHFCF